MPRKFLGWARRRSRADNRAQTKAKVRADNLAQIRAEAARNGATLETDGEGGVDPAIALEVFRRDNWRCSNEDCPTPQENLTLDHISGHPNEIAEDAGASNRADLKAGIKLGHIDDPEALHALCARCHARVHQRERAIQQGDKPQAMRGSR
jgi:hypothetical protein